MYLAWAIFCEGPGDKQYFEVLLPRLLDDIIRVDGSRAVEIPPIPAITPGRRGQGIEAVAREICRNAAAFHLLFIHADPDGRVREADLASRSAAYCRAVQDQCAWPPARCVLLTPRRETEAWALADPGAVTAALGFTGSPADIGLPENAAAAERLPDPKAVLELAASSVRGRRSRLPGAGLLAAIAGRQAITALRQAASFQEFETRLRAGLVDLGCLAAPP